MTKPVVRPEHQSEIARVAAQVDEDTAALETMIGRLVRRWSLLHDRLAEIFGSVSECPPGVAYAIWHSLRSDLVQRNVLSATMQAQKEILKPWKDDPQRQLRVLLYDEFIWALNQITAHSHKRNDLVHAPIIFFRGVGADEFEAPVSKATLDPRGSKLADKDLFQYCAWSNAFTDAMIEWLWRLPQHQREHGTLPERPQWPPLSTFPTQKQGSHRKNSRSPPLRPRSSEA